MYVNYQRLYNAKVPPLGNDECRSSVSVSEHTSFRICCSIVVVSENSGRSDGSLFQHFCKSSASFGLIFLGIVGRNPCKVQNTHIKTKGRT